MKPTESSHRCTLCGMEFHGPDALAKVAIHRAQSCPKRNK